MNRYLVEKSDGSITFLHCEGDPSSFLLEDQTLIGLAPDNSELPDASCKSCWVNNSGTIEIDLTKLKAKKQAEIEDQQKALLLLTDKPWVEAMTKADATMQSDVEADKVIIRAVNNQAVTDLDGFTTAQEVMDYDPIPALTLNRTYE